MRCIAARTRLCVCVSLGVVLASGFSCYPPLFENKKDQALLDLLFPNGGMWILNQLLNPLCGFSGGERRLFGKTLSVYPFSMVILVLPTSNKNKKPNPIGFGVFAFAWGKVDSNHRRRCQQIYSLSPLATREFPLELVIGVEPTTC